MDRRNYGAAIKGGSYNGCITKRCFHLSVNHVDTWMMRRLSNIDLVCDPHGRRTVVDERYRQRLHMSRIPPALTNDTSYKYP
jgi:hypothetical protein